MKEPTMEEMLELVEFERGNDGKLFVLNVKGNVGGDVQGYVKGDVRGNVFGIVFGTVGGSVRGSVLADVYGSVGGDVGGSVGGTINGREWQFIETPKERAIRLIREGKGEEAIEVLEEE